VLPRQRIVQGERYGEYREFFPSGRAGTGNLEPSYEECSVLLFSKFFEKNHHFCAHCLILHLPVSFSYVLSSVYSKNMHTESQKSNNNGFWNFSFFLRDGPVRGSAEFPVPYRPAKTPYRSNTRHEVRDV
jgi:hypothetical protein